MRAKDLSRWFRLLSYLVLPLLVITGVIASELNACSGVGCMGRMSTVMVALVGAPVLAALLNAASYLTGPVPASQIRKFELMVFAAPALLAVLLTLFFVADGGL